MVICTFDNLIDKVTRNKISKVRIVDGVPDDEGKLSSTSFDTFKDSNLDGMVKKLEKFAINYPKTFTAVLSKEQGGRESKMVFQIDFDTFNAVKPMQGVKDNEKTIEDRIYARIKAEEEAKTKERENEDLRTQLAEFKTGAGKLNYFIMSFIEGYMAKSSAGAPMQGNNSEPSKQDLDDLENAFAILLKHIGEKDIISMANKIESDPNIIMIIKTMFK